MREFMLDGRVSSAAKFVRQGAVFADIGTDHAHLPIFLLECGRIERAVCSDINEGPLASARHNAAEAGLLDKTEFVLCDGASALSDKGITDYAICGMGGELIRDIISSAPELHREGINLVLQPMSKAADLRSYLYGAGFDIVAEAYSHDAGKYYVTLLARYTGTPVSISDTEALLGKREALHIGREEELGYFKSKLRSLKKTAEGKIRGGEDNPREIPLLASVAERISELSHQFLQ
jgi:tRNA (adenine22-N1)-methyltransferase